jgi:hypothetical protein
MAKSGFVFYNYGTSEVVGMPEEFRATFICANWID